MPGQDFAFDPSQIDSQEFLNSFENPSAKVSQEIIGDVVNEVQSAFEEEGVPPSVLEMLQKLWIQKLEQRNEASTSSEAAPKPAKLKKRKIKKIQQLDGPNDSSDSDEEINDEVDDDDDNDSDDDDDDDDDIDGDEEDQEGEGAEDEPLGSGDDISEGDPSDLFNTENVVVCQYDKIQRVRNKWKFHLKDGIMNLNGKDYVFQKATGEAEW